MIKQFFKWVLIGIAGILVFVFFVAVMCFIAWDTPDKLIANSWLFRILLLPSVGIAGGVAYSLTYDN